MPTVPHFPMLMIPNNDREEEEEEEWRLYSLPNKRLHNSKIPIPTDINTNNCRGSTQYGWLVFVDDSRALHLLNPFSLQEIQLPPLKAFPYPYFDDEDEIEWAYDPRKAVLSSNPSSTFDFHVLAILNFEYLAFYRSGGDKVWSLLEHPEGPPPSYGRSRYFQDAIFYNQKFYVVDNDGKVMACDIRDPHPSLTIVASPPPPGDGNMRYLVESLGDLLQVERIAFPYTDWETEPNENINTYCFIVYKLDSTEGKWMEVNSLEDRSLFLGNNNSLSISASDFPGCRPNCIYFTDNYGGHDFGIFNLEDGNIEPLLFPRGSFLVIPPPLWVLPTETLE